MFINQTSSTRNTSLRLLLARKEQRGQRHLRHASDALLQLRGRGLTAPHKRVKARKQPDCLVFSGREAAGQRVGVPRRGVRDRLRAAATPAPRSDEEVREEVVEELEVEGRVDVRAMLRRLVVLRLRRQRSPPPGSWRSSRRTPRRTSTSASSSSRCDARSPRSSSCSRSRCRYAGSASASRRSAGAAASASSRRSVYGQGNGASLLATAAQRNERGDPHRAVTEKLGRTVLFHVLRDDTAPDVPAPHRRSGVYCRECKWEVDCASTLPSRSSSPPAFPQASASPSSPSYTERHISVKEAAAQRFRGYFSHSGASSHSSVRAGIRIHGRSPRHPFQTETREATGSWELART